MNKSELNWLENLSSFINLSKLKYSFCLALFLFSNQAHTQLKVTNNSKNPLWIAIAYYTYANNYKGYISQGWWKIIPGETATIGNFEITSGNNNFYYYAYYYVGNTKHEWKGENFFATSNDAFKIINADKAYVLKENSNYQSFGFRKKHFYLRTIDPKTYTLNLTD